jgi:hypothetical protein
MASKSSSRMLTDHEEIRRWAEERGAKPAAARDTGNEPDDPGIIRLDFPGYSGEGSLEQITWDEWFEDFEDNELALVVQDKMANGQKSNFNKLVSRESALESSPDESAESKANGEGTRSPKRGSRKTSKADSSAEEQTEQSGKQGKRTSKKRAA